MFVDDESAGVYDLLIGADGLNSTVRDLIGIETKPEPTGMGIWRTFVSRPAEVERSELYYGGPVYIAGYTPTGENSMYAFLVEKAEDRFGTSDEDATRIMLEESRAYDGPWNAIRADLEAGAHANYTWFTKHIVDAPWNRGRVVIIGDAAHSCPPRSPKALPRNWKTPSSSANCSWTATSSTTICGANSTRVVCRAPPPSSRPPSSSDSGRSTATATPTPVD